MTPPVLEEHSRHADLPSFVDYINNIFCWDFRATPPSLYTHTVHLKKQPLMPLLWKTYDWTFHHIVTREDSIAPHGRVLCTLRSSHIRFPRHYIDYCSGMHVWSRRKWNEDKLYISDNSFLYLVVLARRKITGNWILLSAFPTDGNYYRRRLQREFNTCGAYSPPT